MSKHRNPRARLPKRPAPDNFDPGVLSRFAGIAMDELLAGQWLSSRVCPHCGHPPDDFVDEETMVE